MQQYWSKFTKILLPLHIPALMLSIYESVIQKPVWHFSLILFSGAFMNQLVSVLAVHYFKPKTAFKIMAFSFWILCSLLVIMSWNYDFEQHNDDPELKADVLRRYRGCQTMMTIYSFGTCFNVVAFYKFKHSFPVMTLPFLIQYFACKHPAF